MFTKIECGECGGEYRRSEAFTYTCVECDHSITQFDVVLDEGESLASLGGVLGYVTEEVGLIRVECPEGRPLNKDEDFM